MKIFIHDLCDNIQSTGRGIPVKENAQTYTDDQNIAENIQFLTVVIDSKFGKIFSNKPRKTGSMILVYTVFTPNSRPQVRKPIIRSITFRIIVIADSGSGMKLDSTIPRPEILLTEGMAWYQEKIYRSSNDRDSNGQY